MRVIAARDKRAPVASAGAGAAERSLERLLSASPATPRPSPSTLSTLPPGLLRLSAVTHLPD